jgi:DNA (cytosine-5)-methyltransferase 1
VAWDELGWTPVAFSEIEKFPSAVLAHHYPTVPNWGDMTKFKEWPNESIDLLVGGTPCQSFSVAGLRKGLDDPRGNLMLTFLAIADRYRPEWLVWENVPGVLSSNRGKDFGTFLGALGELGYGWAYRILDAQYFGVAQRRRRVFVVGNSRGWQRSAAVLFERESLCGNPAPSREAGKDVAGTFKARANSGGWGHDVDLAAGGYMVPEVVGTLEAHDGAKWGSNQWVEQRKYAIISSQQSDAEMSHTFSTPAIGDIREDAIASSLTRNSGGGGETQNAAFVSTSMQVRRLTPRECERLQGFPDDYTLIPHRNKLSADGPRYKALGNSMAVPVMRYIGQRIQMVNKIND